MIKLSFKIIELLETLHQKDIVHGNLNPWDIFISSHNIEKSSLSFNSLYHTIWSLGSKRIPGSELTLHTLDLRLKDTWFLSPEQINLGEKYQQILEEHKAGILDLGSKEIKEYFDLVLGDDPNRRQVTKQSDIYSIGAIMYTCLIGKTPPKNIGDILLRNIQ